MAQLSSHRFESDRQFILLNRADHFAMWIARTSPENREEVLVMAELVHDLADTPTIRRAAGQLVTAIEELWKE